MKKVLAIVLALSLLGGAIRLFYLDSRSLDGDEGAVLAVASQVSSSGVIKASARDVHPPLLGILTHLVISNFEDFSPALVRLVSWLSGVLLISATWFYARRFVSEQIALTASALVAFSGFLLPYSQELRMYPLFGLWFILNLLFFDIVRSNRQPLATTLWLASSALMVWTHYLGTIILGAQWVYLFLQAWNRFTVSRRQARNLLAWLIASGVILLVLLAPIIPLARAQFTGRIIEQASGQATLVGNLVGLGNFFFRLGFGRLLLGIDPNLGYFKQLILEHGGQAFLFLAGGVVYLLLVGGGFILSFKQTKRSQSASWLMTVVALGSALVFSEIGTRAVRNLSFLYPIFALWMALAVHWFWRRGWLGKAVVGGFALIQVLSIGSWYQQARQPGVKRIAQYLSQNATSSEAVLAKGSFGQGESFVLNYYFHQLGVKNPPAAKSFFEDYQPGNLKQLREIPIEGKLEELFSQASAVWFYDFTYSDFTPSQKFAGKATILGRDKENQLIKIWRITKS